MEFSCTSVNGQATEKELKRLHLTAITLVLIIITAAIQRRNQQMVSWTRPDDCTDISSSNMTFLSGCFCCTALPVNMVDLCSDFSCILG